MDSSFDDGVGEFRVVVWKGISAMCKAMVSEKRYSRRVYIEIASHLRLQGVWIFPAPTHLNSCRHWLFEGRSV